MSKAKGWHKKIDYIKFCYVYEKWLCRQITSTQKCAEIVGLSRPTLVKYFNMVLLGEPLPENLFFEESLKGVRVEGKVYDENFQEWKDPKRDKGVVTHNSLEDVLKNGKYGTD